MAPTKKNKIKETIKETISGILLVDGKLMDAKMTENNKLSTIKATKENKKPFKILFMNHHL